MPSEPPEDRPLPERNTGRSFVSRRSFLQTSAGVASGVAVTVVTPVAAAAALEHRPDGAALPAGVPTTASGPVQPEPVMAYVRDARLGEVTIVSGMQETTYRDPALARRLLDAARSHNSNSTEA